ncbi:MFS transporter [Verrucomicrobia bacterium]|nr:MFS transporter [Verrucomicrobiota bacterium]
MNDSPDKVPPWKPELTTVPEDALGGTRRMTLRPVSQWAMLASLRQRNYRIFFLAQVVSLTGTWMQMVAEGWLVYELTKSPMALGLIRFLHTIPVTMFTFYGGVLADRFQKRTLLVLTQSCALIFSLLLYLLTAFTDIQIWQIGALAFALGMSNAFDIPVRQSFVVDMVGKRNLTNAIALNSSVFNVARIVGPAIAGLLLIWFSPAACFLLNCISYAAVIFGYMAMRLPAGSVRKETMDWKSATGKAVQWIWRHPEVRVVFLLVSTISLFGMAYNALMPVFSKDILMIGADGYGWLLTANGVGALVGSISLAVIGDRVERSRLSYLGLGLFLMCMLMFAWCRNPWISAFILCLAGWGMIVFFATSNMLVQGYVSDAYRGRVMGVYSFCFIGLSPFGNFMSGALAKWINAPVALTVGCLVGALALVLAILERGKSRRG